MFVHAPKKENEPNLAQKIKATLGKFLEYL